MTGLTSSETHLLKWLSRDIGQYGECHGKDLETLRARGWVRCSGDEAPEASGQWPPPTMFHGVELTTTGYQAAVDLA